MSVKLRINEMLNKPMDRQEFLQTAAVGAMSMIGLSWLAKMIAEEHPKASFFNDGYSAMVYGGPEDGKNHAKLRRTAAIKPKKISL